MAVPVLVKRDPGRAGAAGAGGRNPLFCWYFAYLSHIQIGTKFSVGEGSGLDGAFAHMIRVIYDVDYLGRYDTISTSVRFRSMVRACGGVPGQGLRTRREGSGRARPQRRT
eukprot:SAG31_NODE_16465_length_677_cov_0.929392_2_plen_111_part_00